MPTNEAFLQIDNAVGCCAPHSARAIYVQFSEYTPSELRSPMMTFSTSLGS